MRVSVLRASQYYSYGEISKTSMTLIFLALIEITDIKETFYRHEGNILTSTMSPCYIIKIWLAFVPVSWNGDSKSLGFPENISVFVIHDSP